ncbi:LuxE/PaaK family acyltransferase [Candidatus Lokiarchaeum ossiferum]|uniref:LuxE/PaaK family acyltransferase n=1 Tax=Candidatus Lokiarchaeum ossiferum TaxID=2951803 RepID=UPI00352F9FCF
MDPSAQVKELIAQVQFQLPHQEKEPLLLEILRSQIVHNMEVSPELQKFYSSLGKLPDHYTALVDIPPLPVSMFKYFDLKTCPAEEIIRTMHSSGTTTSTPSKIYINKETSFRQSRGLMATLKNYLGGKRRPVLILDTENVNKAGASTLTARGAAIRGIAGNFGRTKVYVMDEIEGELYINVERLTQFCDEFAGQEILVSGFTYIVWSRFIQQMQEAKKTLDFPNMKLVHSGGWKKLTAQAVTKDQFSQAVATIFGTSSANIIDFYGMVEQLGVVFLDCEAGHKHIPDFAEVIIRDIYTMQEQPIGSPGLIEILNIIPSSYPGQAIITEDVGELIGIDDCPCGRMGKYFEFRSRVEKTETRGCGDTFAEKRGDK